jgi:hypothetical protein
MPTADEPPNTDFDTIAELVASHSGWYHEIELAPGLVTEPPNRVLDTRSGSKPAGGSTRVVNTGHPGATAVVANITTVDTGADGQFLTAWASGGKPNTSVLNASIGDTLANSVIVPVAPDGTFRLYTFRSAHLLVDVSGYFDGGSALPPGGLSGAITGYVQLTSSTNVLGTVSNGTSDDFRLVRVEVDCPGGELETDQVLIGALQTLGFSVNCSGLHTSGASIRGIVDL